MISSVASTCPELIVWVAPTVSAKASRSSLMSTAMIGPAPTTLAAITAERPTEPAPKTANDLPGRRL